VIGGVLALAFAGELAWALSRSQAFAATAQGDRPSFSVSQIGQRLFQEYSFAFEATSILILVAMVGAITLAGRHLESKVRRKSGPTEAGRPEEIGHSAETGGRVETGRAQL
jgi:hypothetical protein